MVQQSKTQAQELITLLAEKCESLPEGGRFMLGLIGAPGAGKSTTAGWLADKLNRSQNDGPEIAVVVPMDGFHRYNSQLRQMNLFELKGVPDSFDAEAFVKLLARIRANSESDIGCPCFDRSIEEPTEGAITVKPEHKIVIVEGNYLLLEKSPWDKVRQIMDEIWYIESDMKEVETRLQKRHELGGRSPEAARKKMESTDLPNARLIEATKGRADRVISLPPLDV